MIVRVAVVAFLAGAVGVAFSATPRDPVPTPRVAGLSSIPTGMSATLAMVRRVELRPVSPIVTTMQEANTSGAPPAPQLLATAAAQPIASLPIAPALSRQVSFQYRASHWVAAGCCRMHVLQDVQRANPDLSCQGRSASALPRARRIEWDRRSAKRAKSAEAVRRGTHGAAITCCSGEQVSPCTATGRGQRRTCAAPVALEL